MSWLTSILVSLPNRRLHSSPHQACSALFSNCIALSTLPGAHICGHKCPGDCQIFAGAHGKAVPPHARRYAAQASPKDLCKSCNLLAGCCKLAQLSTPAHAGGMAWRTLLCPLHTDNTACCSCSRPYAHEYWLIVSGRSFRWSDRAASKSTCLSASQCRLLAGHCMKALDLGGKVASKPDAAARPSHGQHRCT